MVRVLDEQKEVPYGENQSNLRLESISLRKVPVDPAKWVGECTRYASHMLVLMRNTSKEKAFCEYDGNLLTYLSVYTLGRSNMQCCVTRCVLDEGDSGIGFPVFGHLLWW